MPYKGTGWLACELQEGEERKGKRKKEAVVKGGNRWGWPNCCCGEGPAPLLPHTAESSCNPAVNVWWLLQTRCWHICATAVPQTSLLPPSRSRIGRWATESCFAGENRALARCFWQPSMLAEPCWSPREFSVELREVSHEYPTWRRLLKLGDVPWDWLACKTQLGWSVLALFVVTLDSREHPQTLPWAAVVWQTGCGRVNGKRSWRQSWSGGFSSVLLEKLVDFQQLIPVRRWGKPPELKRILAEVGLKQSFEKLQSVWKQW